MGETTAQGRKSRAYFDGESDLQFKSPIRSPQQGPLDLLIGSFSQCGHIELDGAIVSGGQAGLSVAARAQALTLA